MNHKTDHEQLLADVMVEGAPADFRQAMLGRTLGVVRRRRRLRHAFRAAAALIFIGVVAFWFRPNRLPKASTSVAGNPAAPYQLIQTQPLPASALVSTQPLVAEEFALAASPILMVETTSASGGFTVINDDQLLELVAPRPAALVRITPTLEQLVFVNPEDEKGFPAN